MPDLTYYVAIPFVRTGSKLVPGDGIECNTGANAVLRAEVMAKQRDHAGALAFSRTGDPDSGRFAEAVLLGKFGDVPDDLTLLY